MKKIVSFIFAFALIVLAGCGGEKTKSDLSVKSKGENNQQASSNSKVEENNKYAESAVYIKKVLPEKTLNVEVMEMVMEKEMQQKLELITGKIKNGISNNYNWYMDYIKKYENQKLPYHKNFGVSEEEYNIIVNAGDYMKLVKGKNGKITINIKDKDTISFSNVENIVSLKDAEIDLIKNEVITRRGVLKYKSKISASDSQKVTGRWNGHRWGLEYGDFEKLSKGQLDENTNCGVIDLTFGILEESKKGIIHYSEKIIENGILVSNGEETLEFNIDQ